MTSPRRAQVVDADRLAALTSRSNRAGLNRLSQQVAALGGCVALTLALPSPVFLDFIPGVWSAADIWILSCP